MDKSNIFLQSYYFLLNLLHLYNPILFNLHDKVKNYSDPNKLFSMVKKDLQLDVDGIYKFNFCYKEDYNAEYDFSEMQFVFNLILVDVFTLRIKYIEKFDGDVDCLVKYCLEHKIDIVLYKEIIDSNGVYINCFLDNFADGFGEEFHFKIDGIVNGYSIYNINSFESLLGSVELFDKGIYNNSNFIKTIKYSDFLILLEDIFCEEAIS